MAVTSSREPATSRPTQVPTPVAATAPTPIAADVLISTRRRDSRRPSSAASSRRRCMSWSRRNTSIPTPKDAAGAARSSGEKVGELTTASRATAPSTTIITTPGVGLRRAASPPAAASRAITTAIPASSTGLSDVPNEVLANSTSHCGEIRTTASPTAMNGADDGESRPPTSCPAPIAAPTESSPISAANPRPITGWSSVGGSTDVLTAPVSPSAGPTAPAPPLRPGVRSPERRAGVAAGRQPPGRPPGAGGEVAVLVGDQVAHHPQRDGHQEPRAHADRAQPGEQAGHGDQAGQPAGDGER